MNQLSKLEKELQECQESKSYWFSKEWDLSVSPRDRWEEDLSNHKAKDFYRRGMLTAISAVVIWAGLTLWGMYLPPAVGYVKMIAGTNAYSIAFVAMCLSSLITLVLLKVIKWYHTKQHRNFTHPVPKPPKVTADEEDDEEEYAYIDKYTKGE